MILTFNVFKLVYTTGLKCYHGVALNNLSMFFCHTEVDLEINVVDLSTKSTKKLFLACCTGIGGQFHMSARNSINRGENL